MQHQMFWDSEFYFQNLMKLMPQSPFGACLDRDAAALAARRCSNDNSLVARGGQVLFHGARASTPPLYALHQIDLK